ncbi:MAG: glycosyltransferase family 39 protein [Anaerolineales bacterium]|nr:glycosyltransferase family 39 protein [Anaerolineales bacterium]
MSTTSIRKWWDQWAHALILGAAALIRLPGLYTRPLWYDEAFAVLFSSKGISAMIYGTLTAEAGVAADVHPLGYYFMLYGWGRLFGISPVSVRTLSLLLGLMSLFLAFELTRELFDRRTALFALGALALAPFPVHYAQEVRMYALLAVLVMGAGLMFIKAVHAPDRYGFWLAFGLFAAGAQYTHGLAFLYLVPISTTALLLQDRKILAKTFLAGAGAVILYVPWLVHLPGQFARLQWAYWINRPGLQEILQVLIHFTSSLPAPQWSLTPVLFFSLSLTCLAGLEMARSVRRRARKSRQAAWVLYIAAAPPALMLIISQWQPIFILRALMPAAIFFTIWLIWAMLQPKLPGIVRNTALGMLAISYGIGLIGWYTFSGFPYAPFEALTAFLRESRQPEDVILHTNKITALPAIFADPNLEQRYLADPPGSPSDTLAAATQSALGLFALPDMESLSSVDDDFWLVMFVQEEQEYLEASYSAHPVRLALEEQLQLESMTRFGDILVYHYSRHGLDE